MSIDLQDLRTNQLGDKLQAKASNYWGAYFNTLFRIAIDLSHPFS
jgi:hypothetical protein